MSGKSQPRSATTMACPRCRTVASTTALRCADCELPLDWIRRFPEFQRALNTDVSRVSDRGPHPVIGNTPLRPTPLTAERANTLGRSRESSLPVHHSTVELQHCVFVRQPDTGEYWLADCGATGGTWLNRKPIASDRLQDGDLIQVGQFAWAFNSSDGYLVPVDSIAGVRVELRAGVGLSGRLGLLPDVAIPAGQFVAITGSSGAGKSTLLKAICGLPGSRDSGQVVVGGQNINECFGWFRSILGYVSQSEFVPDKLTARQAVYYSGRLRGEPAENVDAILLQMGLPRDRWDACIKDLSGGQKLRVRTAAELACNPRLLLLDEPGSGLDLQREQQLMKLLRILSWRGCTIVIVSHNQEAVSICDRVLRVEAGDDGKPGTIVCDGYPEQAMAGHATDPPPSVPDEHVDAIVDAAPPENASGETTTLPVRTPKSGFQCSQLMRREFLLARQDWLRRLIVPLLIMPAFFAVALGTAVRSTADDLLGFFSVLSCIWMGGSLSLMQIVGERDVYDHERHLFLRTSSYVLAKTATLQLLATFQIAVFLSLLIAVRAAMDFDSLPHPGWTLISLLLVAWAGVGLGLLISALAGRSKEMAGFIWPLVMIAQILFSVPVCVGSAKTMSNAYGEFHLHRCFWFSECHRRATRWVSATDDRTDRWLCSYCSTISASTPRDAVETAYEDRNRPNQIASAISYATASRYGDIAIRSVTAITKPATDSHSTQSRWWGESTATLLSASLLLLLTTAVVLNIQGRSYRLKDMKASLGSVSAAANE